jgi:hypothetical protein
MGNKKNIGGVIVSNLNGCWMSSVKRILEDEVRNEVTKEEVKVEKTLKELIDEKPLI